MMDGKLSLNLCNGIREVENLLPIRESGYERLSLPVNAVLVQMWPYEDEDGVVHYQRVFSTICVDQEMSDALNKEARRLMALSVESDAMA